MSLTSRKEHIIKSKLKKEGFSSIEVSLEQCNSILSCIYADIQGDRVTDKEILLASITTARGQLEYAKSKLDDLSNLIEN